MTEISSLSVIALNVNELNSPIKREIGKMDKKKTMIQLYVVY